MNFSRKKVFIARAFVLSNNVSHLFFAFTKNHLKLWSKVLYGSGYYCIPIDVLKIFSIELVVLWMNIAVKWKSFPPNKELESSFEMWRLFWIWLKYIFTLIYLHFNPKSLLQMCIVYSMQFITFHHLIFCILCFFVVFFNVLFWLIMKKKSLESMGINMLK
jgi:hypothetical protein